jgi:hypothetical protein
MQDHNYILLNTELLSKFTASFTRRAYKQVSELPNINSMADLHFDKQEINNCFVPCLFKKPKAHYNVHKNLLLVQSLSHLNPGEISDAHCGEHEDDSCGMLRHVVW